METMFKNMLLFNGLLLCYDLCYDFCWDVSRINVFCHGNGINDFSFTRNYLVKKISVYCLYICMMIMHNKHRWKN